MLFKFLCTLCALVGNSSPINQHAITNSLIANDSVKITVKVDDIMAHNLCNDFAPNITNATCSKTLFEASRKEEFITIANSTMILTPTDSDLSCYTQKIYTSICFLKTYQFKISALKDSDRSLIVYKNFKVVVLPLMSKKEIETLIITMCVLGSIVACGAGMCIEKLHIRLRREIVHEYS